MYQLDSTMQQANPNQIGYAASPQPVQAINISAAEVHASLEELTKIASELAMRLSSVLRPTGPQQNNSKAEQIRDACSPMRDMLDNFGRMNRQTRAVLLDIMDRLEV